MSVRADGIAPDHVTLMPGQGVWFTGAEPATVTWEGSACTDRVLTEIPPPGSGPCTFEVPGRYTFHVNGFTGSATVLEPDWVTITDAKTAVVYGKDVQLTGTVYVLPHYGGPPRPPVGIFIAGRTVIGGGPTAFGWSSSPGDGNRAAWAIVVRPTRTTWFHAHAYGHHSAEVRIDVRPQLVLRRARGLLIVQPTPRKPYSRRYGQLQRRSADGSWQTVSTFRFGSDGTARLRPKVSRGAVVRAYLPAIGDVYADAVSAPFAVR